ncbi:MAG: NAD(P)H-hydrate dehydratase [Candidatus Woesearchaeota archaeon]|nr:NAD(P)H-hydrate dehydratase [Candidatus Woesearchaeota archaeon]
MLTKNDLVLKERKRGSHKGQHGRVLVVGGSPAYVGAVTLAGLAALHNCDLVTVAAPEKVAWAVNCQSPDLMTVKLPGKYLQLRHFRAIQKLAKKADVILLGNGAGLRKHTQALLRKLALLPCKKVIDADGITALDFLPDNTILTPHQRELATLKEHLGVRDLQLPTNTVVITKGAVDTIQSATKTERNRTGNPGMTRGGTGDVLAGLAAGYFTHLTAWEAACNATYVNGMVGDVLAKKRGYTYLASDLVRELKTLQ